MLVTRERSSKLIELIATELKMLSLINHNMSICIDQHNNEVFGSLEQTPIN